MATFKFSKIIGSTVLVSALLMSQYAAASAADGNGKPAAPGQGHKIAQKDGAPGAKGKQIVGHYIVTVSKGSAPKGVAAEVDAKPAFVYTTAVNGFAAELTDKQLQKLLRHPHVLSVEPDYEVQGDGTQLMDSNAQPWGLDRIDQRARALSGTYTYYGTGRGVTAYIIDSGINTTHPDFGGRAVNLYDAIGDGQAGRDCHGHGTHVAGTVGGARYGVAKRVMLRGIRVLNCSNKGSIGGIIGGVDWVAAHAVKPAVANISIGASYSATLNAAVTSLTKAGVFVAVAAGNDNQDACTHSPSSAPGTLTVASVNYTDTKASDSNWGACVDLYAPGVAIASAGLNGGETIMSGTSMASPHATGLAALIKGDYGDIASPDLVNYIVSYTTNGTIRGNISGTPSRLLFQAGW
jgi:subtilisin family serine protease